VSWSFCYLILHCLLQLALLRPVGELEGLGLIVSATRRAPDLGHGGARPCRRASRTLVACVLRAQAKSMLAVDLFTIEIVSLRRRYVLFFVELESRRVHFAGCTAK
jgi:putative transposase